MRPLTDDERVEAAHKWTTTFKLVGCAAGILVCYFYFGIMQEKM